MTRNSDSVDSSVQEESNEMRSRWDELTIEEKGQQFRQMEASAALVRQVFEARLGRLDQGNQS